MKKLLLPLVAGAFLICPTVLGDEDLIAKAMSAGPEAIASKATIMLPDGTVLREGSDYWTCFPYFGTNVDTDPMCGDPTWTVTMLAGGIDGDWGNSTTGFSYMLAGGYPHLMVIVPELESYEGFNTDPGDGKTWVMSFPALHFMIPIEMEAEETEEEMATEADEADE